MIDVTTDTTPLTGEQIREFVIAGHGHMGAVRGVLGAGAVACIQS